MALVHADRVKETSTTTGTGTYSLAGAATGFQTFVAGIGNGNTCLYCAEDGTDWEVGVGTVTDATPDTLARTTILASSNAGGAVNWGAGTRTLFCTLAAARFIDLVALLGTQGDIPYRGASALAALGAGTANQRLITGGSGANPSWGGGIATIASGSLPAATTQSFTGIPAIYSYLVLRVTGGSSNTATRHMMVVVDTDNGASYDTTASSYQCFTFGGTGVADAVEASMLSSDVGAPADVTAATTASFTVNIFNYQGGPNAFYTCAYKDSAGGSTRVTGHFVGSTSAINAIQIKWSGSGNFDAGTYALYGVM